MPVPNPIEDFRQIALDRQRGLSSYTPVEDALRQESRLDALIFKHIPAGAEVICSGEGYDLAWIPEPAAPTGITLGEHVCNTLVFTPLSDRDIAGQFNGVSITSAESLQRTEDAGRAVVGFMLLNQLEETPQSNITSYVQHFFPIDTAKIQYLEADPTIFLPDNIVATVDTTLAAPYVDFKTLAELFGRVNPNDGSRDHFVRYLNQHPLHEIVSAITVEDEEFTGRPLSFLQALSPYVVQPIGEGTQFDYWETGESGDELCITTTADSTGLSLAFPCRVIEGQTRIL